MQWHSRRRHGLHAGLTLLELMFVLAIVGVLLGLIYGVSQKLAESTRVSMTLKTISMLYNAFEAHRFLHGDYPDVEDGNRLTFDTGAAELMDPSSAHVLNAVYANYKFDMSDLDSEGVYLDPWGNPFVYEYIYPEDGDAATEGSGVWWAERGVTSRVKIYSVGAEDNFDTARNTGPYWRAFVSPDTDDALVLYKQIGE